MEHVEYMEHKEHREHMEYREHTEHREHMEHREQVLRSGAERLMKMPRPLSYAVLYLGGKQKRNDFISRNASLELLLSNYCPRKFFTNFKVMVIY